MSEKTTIKKKQVSPDWFVRGLLTKIGDTFDRFTGRGWRPSSSLATSELSERLKALIDGEAREAPDKRLFVPHNIKLRMQWDKFSTDSEGTLEKLQNELLTALVDHINDRRYYTYSPISLTVKPDYFTNGVKLLAGFDESEKDESEASLNVTVPSMQIDSLHEIKVHGVTNYCLKLSIVFRTSGDFEKTFEMNSGDRLSVGRTKESDLAIDDPSVSKMHAALLLNNMGVLLVSDTGSTNGTFINAERIAYGKAIEVGEGCQLRFGTIDVQVRILEKHLIEAPELEDPVDPDPVPDDTVQIGDFQFTRKIAETNGQADSGSEAKAPSPTLPSIEVPERASLESASVEQSEKVAAPTVASIQIPEVDEK